MKRLMLAALLAGTAIAPALAQEHEHRHAGTHVHGLAELAVAVNPDGTLVAEMESPLYNLIGFERAPRDDAEYALVAAALAKLESDARPGFNTEAGCVLSQTAIEGFPHASAQHGHEHHEAPADHEGDDHDHDHGHEDGHAHHDAHDHDEHSHDEAEHVHDHFGDHSEAETPPAGDGHGHDHDAARYSDGFVSWTYMCSQPDRLARIETGDLFAGFERLERVNVQFFDGTRNAAGELTPASSTLQIR
ncbi:MAG: ZrgA family zinc uptake protein [Caulobacterales bacterium]|uniref:ZrgA family zinc uptake protein n=1 Tax=Glycocaulis sp. TaxID=1969725 RepID=UPI003F9F327A